MLNACQEHNVSMTGKLERESTSHDYFHRGAFNSTLRLERSAQWRCKYQKRYFFKTQTAFVRVTQQVIWFGAVPVRDLWTCHVLGTADEKGGCIYTKILFSAAGHWMWMTGEGRGLDGLGSADTVCCEKQKTFGFSFLSSQERDSQLSTRSQREGMFLFIPWRLAFLTTSHVDQPLWKACNQNLLCSSFLDSP